MWREGERSRFEAAAAEGERCRARMGLKEGEGEVEAVEGGVVVGGEGRRCG